MRVMKLLWLTAGLAFAAAAWGQGVDPAVSALREIVAEQKAALAAAKTAEDASVLEDHRPRLQRMVGRYEALLTAHPDFAAGWASYGLFLCDPLLEDRNAALPMLLKANGIDPDIPVVKNQIGVIMAEDGRVVDALNYFLAASDLAPTEPLYHFQIGLLLDEARDTFLKTKAWKREKLDADMLAAFARATTLAPDRVDFAYRAAEAFYGVEPPQWDAAYLAWSRLEERLEGRNETQAVRLHRARVRWLQGYATEARELLASVDAPALLTQKAKLAEEFAAEDKAEADEAAAKVKPASSEGR
jgi:hypothetical protein